jgi:hypothetical protein
VPIAARPSETAGRLAKSVLTSSSKQWRNWLVKEQSINQTGDKNILDNILWGIAAVGFLAVYWVC